MTPTKAGEGKTTTLVGLTQGLGAIGKQPVACLREPSLGPVFGIKGGAAGGGMTQVVPMEDLNLHFTGDIHAIGAANNLLAAMLDASILHGNPHKIDALRVGWRRALDMNDRALRQVAIGLGGRANGYPRETGFDITAASEVMAIMAVSSDIQDLRGRLGGITVAHSFDGGRPITAEDLGAAGAMIEEQLHPERRLGALNRAGDDVQLARVLVEEVAGVLAERAGEVTVAADQHRGAEARRAQHLVRVPDDGVRLVDAGEQAAVTLGEQRRGAVGPSTCNHSRARGRTRRSRAGRREAGAGPQARRHEGDRPPAGSRARSSARPAPPARSAELVGLQLHDRVLAEAGDRDARGHRVVRRRGGEHGQVAGHAMPPGSGTARARAASIAVRLASEPP